MSYPGCLTSNSLCRKIGLLYSYLSLIAFDRIKKIEASKSSQKKYCDLRKTKEKLPNNFFSPPPSWGVVVNACRHVANPGAPPPPTWLRPSSPSSPSPRVVPRTLTDAEDHLRNRAWTRGVSQLHGLPCHPVHVPARPYQPGPGEHATAPAVIKQRGFRWRGQRSGCNDGHGVGGGGDLRRRNLLDWLKWLGNGRTHD